MYPEIEVGSYWRHRGNGYLYKIFNATAKFDWLEHQEYVVMQAVDGVDEYKHRVWIRSVETFHQKFCHEATSTGAKV